MSDAKICGEKTKPLPVRTQAAMNKGIPQRKAVSMTTSPRSTVKVPN